MTFHRAFSNISAEYNTDLGGVRKTVRTPENLQKSDNVGSL
jgi:hypothetical protein